KAFDVGPKWNRLVVTLASQRPVGRTIATVRLAPGRGAVAIGLDHPQLEDGSNATSPIVGNTRAEDQLEISLDLPLMFTLVIEVDVRWNGTDLTRQERRAIGAIAHGTEELSIVVDGKAGGKIALTNYSTPGNSKRAAS